MRQTSQWLYLDNSQKPSPWAPSMIVQVSKNKKIQ